MNVLSSGLSAAVAVFVSGCQPSLPPLEVPPESDAGVLLEPDRDVVVALDGKLVQVTSLPGAEELEVVSPDGAWVAFVSGTTGWASVWAVAMPVPGEPLPTPLQITNVGIEKLPRTPGVAPVGFVPVPDSANGLRWRDDRTLSWTSGGKAYEAGVPR